MPEELEKQLRRQALLKKITGKRADAYVYGTLRKTGWKPKREKRKNWIDPGMLEDGD